MSYYIIQNDETKGPYTIGQLRSMWSSASITGDTLYCEEGYDTWLHMRVLGSELEPQPPSQPSPHFYPQHPPQTVTHKVQTIEATGKSWKAAQLLSALAMIVGVLVAIALPPLGIFMFIGGLFVFCIARIGAWWHHG